MNTSEIESFVLKYYSEKIGLFGPVPQGVDWNGETSQLLRFDQLLKLLNKDESMLSILDYGCGYGALLDHLTKYQGNLTYTGFDISDEMIKSARATHSLGNSVWTAKSSELSKYDYVLTSGIFNVKGSITRHEWERYVFEKLNHISDLSVKGFAFNMLTAHADEGKKRDTLYYADPAQYFKHCISTFGKHVALLHDYALFEFTILVRKNPA